MNMMRNTLLALLLLAGCMFAVACDQGSTQNTGSLETNKMGKLESPTMKAPGK
jgi:hypothetical protein